MIVWRLLFLCSALILAAALLLRGWLGKRGFAQFGGRICTADAERWQSWTGESLPEANDAGALGRKLRRVALNRWQRADPKAARAREAARRFGLAVPPLTIVVLVFAVALAKLPLFGALTIALGATALSAGIGLLSIGAELRAVGQAAGELRGLRIFRRADDEEAVIACAQAAVWMAALPPILGK
ncbi:MAG TPA: hypothetical protein VIM57_10490 [Luteolibacter sp.]